MQNKYKTRREDIDITRAFAIFGLVVHHISQYFVRYNFVHFSPKFSTAAVATVSYFDVPLFMFVAGVTFALKDYRPESMKGYMGFEKKKFLRLMLPYFCVSSLQLAIKFIKSDIGTSEVLAAIGNMILVPLSAPAPHLWFLYTLMTIFLIWPILLRFNSNKIRLLLGVVFVAMAVIPINWPKNNDGHSLFALSNITTYLPVFALGYFYEKYNLNSRNHGLLWILFALAIMILALIANYIFEWPQSMCWQILKNSIRLIGYTSGALSFLWLSKLIAQNRNLIKIILAKAGLYSYDVYLLHVAFAAHPLVLIAARSKPNLLFTIILFLILPFITIMLSVILGQLIRKFNYMAFVVLGVPIKTNSSRN